MASALIDTSLLVLLVVGKFNKNYICKHKRTKEFTERDYNELLSALEGFDSLWVTSHCLADVSNLLKQTDTRQAQELLSTLAVIYNNSSESHISKENIFASEHYLRLGIADTGFIQKSKKVTCSFTIDFNLYQSISKLGRKVINFNHLRAGYLYEK